SPSINVDDGTWSISHFHQYWNREHGEDPKQNYFKSADALEKSLRAIFLQELRFQKNRES
ncbi:666_t:CDS:1, partial [Funneliformis caledonium]